MVLLPPLLILDAALSGDDDKPGVTALGVVAAYVGCLPLVLRARWSFFQLAPLLTAGVVLVLFALEPGNTVVLIPMVALVQLAIGARPAPHAARRGRGRSRAWSSACSRSPTTRASW